MGIAGKSSEELLKDLPGWKAADFREFWGVGWRSGSKQQAVVAWDRAIKDLEQSTQVVAAAKRYKQICKKNDTPLTMAATWLNQARWETVPKVKEQAERDRVSCKCGAPATQQENECDRCWADAHSVQLIDGAYLPYKPLLAAQLKKMGITVKDGETRAQFSQRCRDEFHRRSGGVIYKQKGKVGLDTGA